MPNSITNDPVWGCVRPAFVNLYVGSVNGVNLYTLTGAQGT